MSRIAPLEADQVPEELQGFLESVEEGMGFKANDVFLLARVPGLMQALSGLVWPVYGAEGSIGLEIKRLISIVTSSAAGCRYCLSHTVHGAEKDGFSTDKIKDVWSYETSPLFSEAERAALRVAQGAGHAPVEVTDADFDELKKHFTDDEICEIVAVISVFGFLNKWNDTLSTDLEASPKEAFARLGPATENS